MAEEPLRKPVKIGVVQGQGPPPGYLWGIDIIDRGYDEAMGFLNPQQYQHLAELMKELAMEEEPSRCTTIDIRQIEDYYELRDKGGILKRINARVFFFIHKPSRKIVVLGAINKQNNGKTPVGDRIRMRRRMRIYLEQLT